MDTIKGLEAIGARYTISPAVNCAMPAWTVGFELASGEKEEISFTRSRGDTIEAILNRAIASEHSKIFTAAFAHLSHQIQSDWGLNNEPMISIDQMRLELPCLLKQMLAEGPENSPLQALALIIGKMPADAYESLVDSTQTFLGEVPLRLMCRSYIGHSMRDVWLKWARERLQSCASDNDQLFLAKLFLNTLYQTSGTDFKQFMTHRLLAKELVAKAA